MKIDCFIGPMWAGKTTRLVNSLYLCPSILALDHEKNTRGTERELFRQLKKRGHSFDQMLMPSGLTISEKKYDYLLVDGVHFLNVFGGYIEFVNFLDRFIQINPNVSIYLAGIAFDCYDSYKLFSIWGLLRGKYNSMFYFCNSFLPCALCGKRKEIYYSVHKENAGEKRCSDEYESRCIHCLMK